MGFLNVPFIETFETLFPWTIEKASGKFGPFFRRVVRSESEFQEIYNWLEQNENVVFICSLLDSCVALSEHQTEPGVHSEIGALEKAAKFDADRSAEEAIIHRMVEVYARLFQQCEINAICSVPPSTAGAESLPNRVATALSAALEIEDLTQNLRWLSAKPSIKETPVGEKWDVLESVGLGVDEVFKGRRVLLIDDMYQSGSTIHFVASKLQQVGVDDVHCFAIVKALSDKDNK